jgi:hypothetical protein
MPSLYILIVLVKGSMFFPVIDPGQHPESIAFKVTTFDVVVE